MPGIEEVLDAFLADVRERSGTPQGKAVLAGFEQAGEVALEYALKRPGAFRGVACVSAPFEGAIEIPMQGSEPLSIFFTQASKGRWWVCVQDPVHLDEHSEPEPDLMLLKRDPGSYTSRHPEPEDVYLLVEVSDASLATDREEKLPIYSRAGIAEVWIVNLVDLIVEVYREPHFTGYGSKSILRAGDQARSQAFPDAAVDVAELLKH